MQYMCWCGIYVDMLCMCGIWVCVHVCLYVRYVYVCAYARVVYVLVWCVCVCPCLGSWCVCVCGGCVFVCDPLKIMSKMIQEFLLKLSETVNADTE